MRKEEAGWEARTQSFPCSLVPKEVGMSPQAS